MDTQEMEESAYIADYENIAILTIPNRRCGENINYFLKSFQYVYNIHMINGLKFFFLFPLLIIMLLPSCKEKPKNPIAEYGNALMNAHQRSKDTAEKANLDAIQETIRAYRASNDKYPESLNDIQGMIGSPIDFSRYNYDPQTGTVSLK